MPADLRMSDAEGTEALIKFSADNLLVFRPGKIVKYDPDTFKAEVQILPKIIYPGRPISEMMDFPIIYDVPVITPRVDAGEGGPKAIIYLPIKPGTLVGVLFSDVSLDNFLYAADKDKANTYDTQDVRRHHATDAVAIPGLYPFTAVPAKMTPSTTKDGTAVDPSDIRIVLEWEERGIKSEVYLGGDTGDIVAIPSQNVVLGTKDASRSPVPQEAIKAWLTDVLSEIEDLCDAIGAATYGGNPIDAPTKVPIDLVKTNLIDLMARFDADNPPLAGNSYNVASGKVKIP